MVNCQVLVVEDDAAVRRGIVDALTFSGYRPLEAAAGDEAAGSVLASDAMMPFTDNIEMAAEAGITAVVQPGGSIRDEEVIAEANKAGMAMVFTGVRHFRH